MKDVKKILNSEGFSLVEVIIASVILSIIGVFAAKGIGVALKDINQAQTQDARVNLASSIIGVLVSNADRYQVDLTNVDAQEYLANPNNFAMAWDKEGQNTTVDKCPECKGRYDFIFKPVEGHGGIYYLYVTFYHPDFPGEVKMRSYTRIVGSQ
ncbi:MAG: type IV pilus modification PilV family protein [Bacteriovoracaceae bacterium]